MAGRKHVHSFDRMNEGFLDHATPAALLAIIAFPWSLHRDIGNLRASANSIEGGEAGMDTPELDLPASLLDRLEPDAAQELARGRLGGRLIRVRDKAEGPAYLKIGTGIARRDVLCEADRLDWMGDRLPVPRVLLRATQGDRAFVLISELPGVPAHECLDAVSVPVAVEKLAEGLKAVHTVSTEDCPFDRTLENDLAESARRIGSPGLNVEAFAADTGATPSEALDELTARAAQPADPVFTHGDYCFPNLLLDRWRIGGIVDWGAAGIGDRHRDFMSVELTIRRNCGEAWIPAFYEAYGADEVDPTRIRFFRLLDRFFAHYEYPSRAGGLDTPA